MDTIKKKLCIIVPTHWDYQMGGAQYQVKILMETLIDENKYDITFLTSRSKSGCETKEYRIIKIADRTGLGRFGFFFDTRKLLKILNLI